MMLQTPLTAGFYPSLLGQGGHQWGTTMFIYTTITDTNPIYWDVQQPRRFVKNVFIRRNQCGIPAIVVGIRYDTQNMLCYSRNHYDSTNATYIFTTIGLYSSSHAVDKPSRLEISVYTHISNNLHDAYSILVRNVCKKYLYNTAMKCIQWYNYGENDRSITKFNR